MSKDVIYFAENICGIKLTDWQIDLLIQAQEANEKGELMLVNLGRRQGGQLLNTILINFQIWSKDQKISDLEAKLAESEKRWVEENEEKCELKKQLKFIKDEIEVNFVDGQKYNELKQQLAEKDKEFEWLHQKLAKGINAKAIEELEKVRKYVDGRTYLAQYLNERVNQLKEGK